MTRGPSNRALFESGLIIGLIVAVVACGLIATRPAPPFTPPPLTETQALDLMRTAADSHQETLESFKVVRINGQYVRAIITVPEESVFTLPVDITYEYGWHLTSINAVRGKLPGPG